MTAIRFSDFASICKSVGPVDASRLLGRELLEQPDLNRRLRLP